MLSAGLPLVPACPLPAPAPVPRQLLELVTAGRMAFGHQRCVDFPQETSCPAACPHTALKGQAPLSKCKLSPRPDGPCRGEGRSRVRERSAAWL